jgi:hypothetical protein
MLCDRDLDLDPPVPVSSMSVTVAWKQATAEVELVPPPPPYILDATPRLPVVSVVVSSAGALVTSIRRVDSSRPGACQPS